MQDNIPKCCESFVDTVTEEMSHENRTKFEKKMGRCRLGGLLITTNGPQMHGLGPGPPSEKIGPPGGGVDVGIVGDGVVIVVVVVFVVVLPSGILRGECTSPAGSY